MLERARQVWRSVAFTALGALAIGGCAAILGIDDVPPGGAPSVANGDVDAAAAGKIDGASSAPPTGDAGDAGDVTAIDCSYGGSFGPGVLCGAAGIRCLTAGESCCHFLVTDVASCNAVCSPVPEEVTAWACESPEDCPNDQICCSNLEPDGRQCPFVPVDGGDPQSSCQPSSACATGRSLCRSDGDCPARMRCERMDLHASSAVGSVGICVAPP